MNRRYYEQESKDYRCADGLKIAPLRMLEISVYSVENGLVVTVNTGCRTDGKV